MCAVNVDVVFYVPLSLLALGVVFNDVYTASKFAMEGFCESMAVQLLKFNVRYVLLSPLFFLPHLSFFLSFFQLITT